MQFAFPSLLSNQHAFRFVSDGSSWSDFRSLGNFVQLTLRGFQTFGDGLCAHAPDYLVQKEQFADCLSSLSAFLLIAPETPVTAQIIEAVAGCWPQEPNQADIAFIHGVQWKEGKTRYFSLGENKISASDSKRHDKRWATIEEWQDGSVMAMYRALCPDYSDGLLNRCVRYTACQDYMRSIGEYAGENITRVFDIPKVREEVIHDAPDMAFDALRELVTGFKHSQRAKFLSDRLKSCLQSQQIATAS